MAGLPVSVSRFSIRAGIAAPVSRASLPAPTPFRPAPRRTRWISTPQPSTASSRHGRQRAPACASKLSAARSPSNSGTTLASSITRSLRASTATTRSVRTNPAISRRASKRRSTTPADSRARRRGPDARAELSRDQARACPVRERVLARLAVLALLPRAHLLTFQGILAACGGAARSRRVQAEVEERAASGTLPAGFRCRARGEVGRHSARPGARNSGNRRARALPS